MSFLIVFILGTWFFQPWMIPFGLTAVLAREISYKVMTGNWNTSPQELEETEIVRKLDFFIFTVLTFYYLGRG